MGCCCTAPVDGQPAGGGDGENGADAGGDGAHGKPKDDPPAFAPVSVATRSCSKYSIADTVPATATPRKSLTYAQQRPRNWDKWIEDTQFDQKYRFDHEIKAGLWAVVDSECHHLACRVTYRGDARWDRSLRTVHLARAGIKHPNVLAFKHCYSTGECNVVVEDILNKVSFKEVYLEKVAIKIIRDIVNGVVYLHSRSVVHGDLRPASILIKGSSSLDACCRKVSPSGSKPAAAPPTAPVDDERQWKTIGPCDGRPLAMREPAVAFVPATGGSFGGKGAVRPGASSIESLRGVDIARLLEELEEEEHADADANRPTPMGNVVISNFGMSVVNPRLFLPISSPSASPPRSPTAGQLFFSPKVLQSISQGNLHPDPRQKSPKSLYRQDPVACMDPLAMHPPNMLISPRERLPADAQQVQRRGSIGKPALPSPTATAPPAAVPVAAAGGAHSNSSSGASSHSNPSSNVNSPQQRPDDAPALSALRQAAAAQAKHVTPSSSPTGAKSPPSGARTDAPLYTPSPGEAAPRQASPVAEIPAIPLPVPAATNLPPANGSPVPEVITPVSPRRRSPTPPKRKPCRPPSAVDTTDAGDFFPRSPAHHGGTAMSSPPQRLCRGKYPNSPSPPPEGTLEGTRVRLHEAQRNRSHTSPPQYIDYPVYDLSTLKSATHSPELLLHILTRLSLHKPSPKSAQFAEQAELKTLDIDSLRAAVKSQPADIHYPYGARTDIWSIGVLTCLLLTGTHPFAADTVCGMIDAVCRREVTFDGPEWDDVSDDAKAFVRACLEKDAAHRPTAECLVSHRWLHSDKKHSIENLGATTREVRDDSSNPATEPEKIEWDRSVLFTSKEVLMTIESSLDPRDPRAKTLSALERLTDDLHEIHPECEWCIYMDRPGECALTIESSDYINDLENYQSHHAKFVMGPMDFLLLGAPGGKDKHHTPTELESTEADDIVVHSNYVPACVVDDLFSAILEARRLETKWIHEFLVQHFPHHCWVVVHGSHHAKSSLTSDRSPFLKVIYKKHSVHCFGYDGAFLRKLLTHQKHPLMGV